MYRTPISRDTTAIAICMQYRQFSPNVNKIGGSISSIGVVTYFRYDESAGLVANKAVCGNSLRPPIPAACASYYLKNA